MVMVEQVSKWQSDYLTMRRARKIELDDPARATTERGLFLSLA